MTVSKSWGRFSRRELEGLPRGEARHLIALRDVCLAWGAEPCEWRDVLATEYHRFDPEDDDDWPPDDALSSPGEVVEWLHGQANWHRMAPEPGPSLTAEIDALIDRHDRGWPWPDTLDDARDIFERYYP